MSRFETPIPTDQAARPWSSRQQVLIEAMELLRTTYQLGPDNITILLTAWLERECMLAAHDAQQLHAQGIRPEVAEYTAEDNPGFILAHTFATTIIQLATVVQSEGDEPYRA